MSYRAPMGGLGQATALAPLTVPTAVPMSTMASLQAQAPIIGMVAGAGGFVGAIAAGAFSKSPLTGAALGALASVGAMLAFR